MVRNVLQFLNREWGSINDAALLIAAFTLVSQLLGIVRDRLLAHNLGAGLELDIYYAGFQVPEIMFVLLASLASFTILIPFFGEKLQHGKQEAHQFLNNVFTVFFAGLASLGILAFILMPVLAPLVAPGFDQESLGKLVQISRIMLASPILLGLSNIMGTVTQTFRRFFVFALTGVLYNVGIIIGVAVFYPLFGLAGLAYGVALGAALHACIQVPVLVRQGFTLGFTMNVDWQEIKDITKVSLPRMLTISFSKITFLVLVALASTVAIGSVSVFRLAYNLQSVPLALVGASYSIAAFPTLVKYFSENNIVQFVRTIVVPARQILFWSIPVIITFIVLRAHIVRVILGSGEFGWAETRLTAAALALFVVSIVAQSLVLLLVRGYYAMGKTWRPLWATAAGAITSVVSAIALLRVYELKPAFVNILESTLRIQGVEGSAIVLLALAFSLGSILTCGLLLIGFTRDFLKEHSLGLQKTFFQSLLASLAMGITIYYFLRILDNIFVMTSLGGLIGQVLVSGAIGTIVAFAVLILVDNQEIIDIGSSLRRKFWNVRLRSVDGGVAE